jgi:hypothetical protein
LIVFDASAVVSAALRADSVPERALLHAETNDLFALSAAVEAEIGSDGSNPMWQAMGTIDYRAADWLSARGTTAYADRSRE